MSSTHSPAPWSILRKSSDGKRIIVEGNSDEWERLTCEVDSDDCCSDTAMANAHLISAAPDLLYALEHSSGFISAMVELAELEEDIALDCRKKETGETYKIFLSEIIIATTKAIAKAYGKEAQP